MLNRPLPQELAAREWGSYEAREDRPGEDGPIALLRNLIKLALRYKLLLSTCLIGGLAVSAVYAQSLAPVYKASATLLLEPRRSAASAGELGTQQTLDLNRADSELQTIKSERLLSAVFDSLNLQQSEEYEPPDAGYVGVLTGWWRSLLSDSDSDAGPKRSRQTVRPSPAFVTSGDEAFLRFASRLAARRIGQSYVIEIEYASTDASLPARVANATASAYLFQVIAFKEQIARAGTEALQGRLDSLEKQVDASRRAMQQGSLPSIPTPDADARVIGAALPPLTPSAPRKSLITALGAVLGLLSGFGLIALRLALDRKVRDGTEVARELDLPCLGNIPEPEKNGGLPQSIISKKQEAFVSALHDLRTSVSLASNLLFRDRNLAVAFVCYSANASNSELCKSYAELISRSNKHVTLFTASNGLIGQDMAENKVIASSLVGAAYARLEPDQMHFDEVGGVNVSALHSLDVNLNLFADLGDRSVHAILETARAKGDVVLDLPDLSQSLDALALARFADAVVIVARSRSTTIEEVNEARNLLRRAGSVVIGTVVTHCH